MSGGEKELRAYYRTLQQCFCPALNETVFFNSSGIQHLLYKGKGRVPRTQRERIYRLSLLPFVVLVLSSAAEVTERILSHTPLVITWSLVSLVSTVNGYQTIKVIVIRKGSGNCYFLSVMRVSKNPKQ